MRFTLKDVYSSIHKVGNEIPIGTPASRIRFGEHLSRYRGRGPNFYQVVEYDPEEHDIDQIQWHLTDPDGKVFVREAIITKDFQVVVMADLSRSMMFRMRYPAKLRLLFDTVGNIGLTCFHAQDPMGFIGFADDVIFDERPRVGEDPLYYLLEQVYAFFEKMERADREEKRKPKRKTDFKKAFEFFATRYHNSRCFLIVVSDFIGAEKFVHDQLLRDIAAQHEMVFLFLDDPAEFNVTTRLSRWLGIRFGSLRRGNMETGEKGNVSMRELRQEGINIRRRRKEMRDLLKDLGIDSMVLEYTEGGKQYERLYRFFLNRQDALKGGRHRR